MASKVTNDRKRNEMKEIMAGVFAKGWKPAEIAAVIGVTPSNISSWKAGKNMGTNDARSTLSNLPNHSEPLARVLMEKAVQKAQTNLAYEQNQRSFHASEAGYKKIEQSATNSLAYNLDWHTKELATAQAKQDARDIEYHTRYVAVYQGKTPEVIATETKDRQTRFVEDQDAKIAKAAKYLKSLEKLLANW
jgi:transcriptional regulator with XRE-family HTH domain